MKHKLGNKFWITLVIFSLIGQVAWVVENMYFNVFIYKMFHASASDISIMVGASAVVATLTTWLIGALSDRIGKRKVFICAGYCIWGISIFAFSMIRMDVLSPLVGSSVAAASLGVSLVIIMDCVMTFFGSSANDACFNAWMTDMGDESNRGSIEGINAMMPLVAILVVFGGFSVFNLDLAESWTKIYTIIGAVVFMIGLAGILLVEEPKKRPDTSGSFLHNVCYCFRLTVIRKNPLLYVVIAAFAIFGISIQIFMPYLILYYEQTLHMDNYVLIMAPAIIIAAVITAFYGKNYDKYGFKMSSVPTVIFLMAGYLFLYHYHQVIPVFIGSLLMMTGYLTGMAVFGAMIRDHIPEDKAGMFQGLRIFGQVLIPGIIGPAIGAGVLKNAEIIINSDGTSSFIPNKNIYLAAFIAAIVLLAVLMMIFRMMNYGHYDFNEKDVQIGWTKYPRPQLKRESFYNLNGDWELEGEKIRIPFPPQSYLSGYDSQVGSHLTYHKIFTIPKEFMKDRVLLHFGAVDQVAEIYINGKFIGKHEGGYLPFSYDITEKLKVGAEGKNQLEVRVFDDLSSVYPYGKQRKKRGGMWYTPISGIWQTVWLESVPYLYIKDLKVTPDLNGIDLQIHTNQKSNASYVVKITQGEDTFEQLYHDFDGTRRITIQKPKLWTPDHPYLYQMEISLLVDGKKIDQVQSYFALRTISIKNVDGIPKICLNNSPIFINGVLDQGYFPSGIYLPATEEDYRKDILAMKELGFNTLRKHIKIEPEMYYYYCDKYGMLVMQDMVNNGHYSFFFDTVLPTFGQKKYNDHLRNRKSRVREFFIAHTKETIGHLYNHPCIIGYTIFNEGWGQFDSDAMYDVVHELDTSRLIDSTSGWFKQEKSDVLSLHIYYDTKTMPESDRPIIVSECGGYAYKVSDHVYSKYTHYGYGSCAGSEELTNRIEQMYRDMILPSIDQGLCGCIYTQLSDVEDETNGLLTYDRKICKVNKEQLFNMFQHDIYAHFQ